MAGKEGKWQERKEREMGYFKGLCSKGEISYRIGDCLGAKSVPMIKKGAVFGGAAKAAQFLRFSQKF